MNSYNGFKASQRQKAFNWLMIEYASGRRSRPTVCDACGQAEGIIDPHSEDYSFPFGPHIGAYGLCYICHMMVHNRFKAAASWTRYKAAIAAGGRYPAMRTRNYWGFVSRFTQDRADIPNLLELPAMGPPPKRLVLEEIEHFTDHVKAKEILANCDPHPLDEHTRELLEPDAKS